MFKDAFSPCVNKKDKEGVNRIYHGLIALPH